MTEFQKIIEFNYGSPPKFIDPDDNHNSPERPERKSLTPLIVVLSIMLAVVITCLVYTTVNDIKIGSFYSSEIACEDNPDGGVRCWRTR